MGALLFAGGAGGSDGGAPIYGSGSYGSSGTTSSGGGWNEYGGDDGGQASSGVAGHTMTYPAGAGGYAIRKNGNSVNVSNGGTITGTQG